MGPIARATVRTSLVFALRLAIQVGTLLLVARMLGPAAFGAFAAFAALALVLGTLSNFGAQLVLLGETARDPNRHGEVLRYAVPMTLICGALLFAGYLVLARLLISEPTIDLRVLAAIGAAEIFLQPLLTLPANQQLALGRVARSQLMMMAPLALRLGAATVVWQLAPADPLQAYGYGYLAASALALLVTTALLRVPWPRLGELRLPRRTELGEMAGYAALGLSATAPTELDKTLAARFLPLEAAGLYAAGGRVVGAVILPVMAMLLSALPRLFREQAGDARRNRLLVWLFGAAVVYGLLLALAIWLAAPLVASLFGPEYHGLVEMIRWLCLAIPGLAIRITAGSVLMAIGRPWVRVSFELTGLAILALGVVVLVPSYGPLGMPLALAGAEWAMAIAGTAAIIGLRNSPAPPQGAG